MSAKTIPCDKGYHFYFETFESTTISEVSKIFLSIVLKLL